MASIRWGILGTGNIAKQFARGLAVLDDADLVAVGSRAQATADAFGDEFDVPKSHPTYEALADDPDVDAIYVSTPHPMHRPNSILCMEAGKAVLCEKPFAINAAEAREMVACARSCGVFLMEAMWTRFLPSMVKVRELIADGAIGDVRMAKADFCFRADLNPSGRLFDPHLGGGGLLDIGVYVVSFARMVFGSAPRRIASLADIGETGVDEQAGIVLGYGEGQMAILTCAVRTTTPHEASIMGTEGMIKVHHPFWHTPDLTLCVSGKDDERISCPYDGNGYNCEAVEVARCLRAGALESDVMPLDETVSIMETLDRIREPWGLKYPME